MAERRPPIRTKGRGAKYHRKVRLDRYLQDAPSRGLGKHRLPRLSSKDGSSRQPRQRRPEVSPLVMALVLVAVAVFFLICGVLSLSLINLLSG